MLDEMSARATRSKLAHLMAHIMFSPPYIPPAQAAQSLRTHGYAVLQPEDFAQWMGLSVNDLQAMDADWQGLPPDAFIYLLFGGISPYKGAHDAIEAVRKVEGRDALLVVLGQCPSQEYAERLRSLAGDDPRVQLRIGALDIPDDEVLLWMAASNAIVTPYSDIYTSGTLHLTATGRNAHHIVESQFKAFARALRQAVAVDPRVQGIPSTKGTLGS